MTRVFVNGLYQCPFYDHSSGKNYDYAGKGHKILFEFSLKPGDVIAIERVFFGITWRRTFWRVDSHVMKGGYWRRVSHVLGKRAEVTKLPPSQKEVAR